MKEIGVRVEDEPEWVGPDPLLQMAAKGHRMVPATMVADAVAAERARISTGLRALHERLSNDAKPKRKRCECGQDMDSHAGGWVLLHHDFFIVDRLADAIR